MPPASLHNHFRGRISDLTTAPIAAAPPEDDLDLTAMARAALNYLRGNPDPARDYECKFSLGPLGIPAHYPEWVPPNQYGYDPISLGDTDCRMEWQYAHMRAMAGEPDPDPVELGVRRRVRGYIGEGDHAWVNPAAWTGEPIEGYWINSWTSGKVMVSYAEEYRATGDAAARTKARAMFLALKSLAHWDGDRAFFPGGPAPVLDGDYLRAGWAADHCRNYPTLVEPCVRYWECTGDAEALDFARAVTAGFIAELQTNQGDMRIDPETGAFAGHIHLHTHAIWGVAHLGVVLGETRYLDWARRPYEYVLGRGTDFGWYPEFAPQAEWRTEICVVGDMVSTGAWLARGGSPEIWDHIERAIRNELRRAQFFLTPEFLALFQSVHADKPQSVIADALTELRKLEGGFVAQPGFDDWVSFLGALGQPGNTRNGIHMMGCCPPEGMRALWEAWCGTVEERPEGVFVNMSFTRDHSAARVTAYSPAGSRLDVAARRTGTYFVRPPAWVDRSAVRLLRNGQDAPITWGGPADAYVICTDVALGDRLTLTCPIPSFTQTFVPTSVPGREDEITVRWVGNTVTEALPHGEYLRMFR